MRKKKKQTSKPPEPVKETSGGDESVKNLEENESLLKGFEGNDENRAELQVSNENRGSGVNQLGVCQINTDLVSIPTVSSLSKSVAGMSVNESQGSSKGGEASVNSSPVSGTTVKIDQNQVGVQEDDAGMNRWRHEFRLEQQAALKRFLSQEENTESSSEMVKNDEGLKKIDEDLKKKDEGLQKNDEAMMKNDEDSMKSGMGSKTKVFNLFSASGSFVTGSDNLNVETGPIAADNFNPTKEDNRQPLDHIPTDQTAINIQPIIKENVLGFDKNIPCAEETLASSGPLDGNKKLNEVGTKSHVQENVFEKGVDQSGRDSCDPLKSMSKLISDLSFKNNITSDINKNDIGPNIIRNDSGPDLGSPAMPLAAGHGPDLSKPGIGPPIELINEIKKASGPVSGVDVNAAAFTAQQLKFGSFDPTKSKVKPNFDFMCENNLTFGECFDIDPVRGTKYWNSELFSKFIKGIEVEESETRLFYESPKKDNDGEFCVELNGHFMQKSVKAHRLQLYGYFIGDNLPFQVVKENLIKMWHKYGVTSIIKKSGGFYFFKFANDDGLLQVLERNPWLVKNVPLVLQLWEPDTILSKPDPNVIPIWVTIKDLPLCLWNGGNIGQIASCVGKPLMLDKATFDRCESKMGPLSYARVLVEANASDGFPDRVKVKFPPRQCLPGKIAFLDLNYRWKPPICHLCGVFGHLTSIHEPKPIVKNVEVPKDVVKQVAKNVEEPRNDSFHVASKTDDFIEVTKKKRKQKNKRNVTWAPVMKAGQTTGPKQTDAGPSGTKQQGNGLEFMAQSAATGKKGTGVFISGSGPVSSPKKKKDAPNLAQSTSLNVGSSSQLDSLDSLGFVDQNPLIGPVSNVGPDKKMKPITKDDGSNRFYALADEDEDECFDADLGIWEHEITLAHKYFNSNTRPPDDEYEKWSNGLKAYFRSLKRNSPPKGSPKKNVVSVAQDDDKKDDSDDVESEMHESARFMCLS